MNLLNKEQIAIIGFFIFTIICKWVGIIYLIILFLFNRKIQELPPIIFCLSIFYLYMNVSDLFEKHNEPIGNIASELNIDDYPIQDYYSEIGYKIDFIGKASDKIYASASKIITLPCQDIKRTDIFLLSGTHVRKLNENERIPKSVADETGRVTDYLNYYNGK